MNEETPETSPPVKKTEAITKLDSPHKITSLFEILLKSPLSLADHIHQSDNLASLNRSLLIISIGSYAIFGIMLGCFSMHAQLFSAPLKFTIGIFLSAIICFPSLYIFCCLTATSAKLKTIFTGLLSTLALIGILLVGLAPIVWVFAQSTNSLGFMGILVLISWVIAFGFGAHFLIKLIKHTGATSLKGTKIWAIIFLLVCLQMSTTLRPILGRSDDFLTNEKRFFLQHWSKSIGEEIEDSEWQ